MMMGRHLVQYAGSRVLWHVPPLRTPLHPPAPGQEAPAAAAACWAGGAVHRAAVAAAAGLAVRGGSGRRVQAAAASRWSWGNVWRFGTNFGISIKSGVCARLYLAGAATDGNFSFAAGASESGMSDRCVYPSPCECPELTWILVSILRILQPRV
jgi:hypothetical protein